MTSELTVCDAVAVRTANTGSNGWGIDLDRQSYTLDQAMGQAVVVFQYKGAAETPSDPSVAPTLRATDHDASHQNGGGHLAVLLETTEPIPIEDPGRKMSGGSEVGSGYREPGSPMYTLQRTGVHGVSTSSSEGFRAKTSAWPESGPVLGETAAVSGLSSDGSCPSCGLAGSSSKTSPASSLAIRDATSPSYSKGWRNSGTMRRGRLSTLKTSESRSAAAACSLSQVLEAEVPSKYSLSARAAAGILRRAERRGRRIPEALYAALRAVAGDTWEPGETA